MDITTPKKLIVKHVIGREGSVLETKILSFDNVAW